MQGCSRRWPSPNALELVPFPPRRTRTASLSPTHVQPMPNPCPTHVQPMSNPMSRCSAVFRRRRACTAASSGGASSPSTTISSASRHASRQARVWCRLLHTRLLAAAHRGGRVARVRAAKHRCMLLCRGLMYRFVVPCAYLFASAFAFSGMWGTPSSDFSRSACWRRRSVRGIFSVNRWRGRGWRLRPTPNTGTCGASSRRDI